MARAQQAAVRSRLGPLGPVPPSNLCAPTLHMTPGRFMGIAEQMGRVLQRTSISVNIKERLDFSCALFDAEGGCLAGPP